MEAGINELINVVNAHTKSLGEVINFVKKLELRIQLLNNGVGSKSQFFQDLFVLQETQNKTNGFFVDFGGTDGVEGSNSYFLEKKFGWNGIVAEPARCWTERLKANRNCIIDTRCVWSESNKHINFTEAKSATLSTVSDFIGCDMHGNARITEESVEYPVETISLTDLLDFHKAPQVIDYLSIDTEGTEYSILSSFDFEKYDIRIITVEHNWTPERAKIEALLTSKGYEKKYPDLTDCDDWYVRKAL